MRHSGTRLGLLDILVFVLVLLAFLTAIRLHTVLSPELTPVVQFTIFLAVALLLTAAALRRGLARGSHLAYTDELTGLRNRRSFTEDLASRMMSYKARGSLPALLLLDLDRFKLVNDTLGHPAGDELLRVVAGRLTSSVPGGSFVGRLGGDEFAVVLAVRNTSEALIAAEDILRALNQPVSLKGCEVWPNSSIGVAVPDSKRIPPGDLLSMADDALYQAKARGKGQAFLFDSHARLPSVHKLSLESELHMALKFHRFEMLYQPVVDLKERRIVGTEALLRWNHPVQGVLTPGAFLSVADETGIGQSLTRWVLGEVGAQCCAWQELFGERVSVSMNVSPAAFQRPDFVFTVARMMRDIGVSVAGLQLEVTESMLMADDPAVKANLSSLRKMGFKVAIDDFGVGLSSLNYLQANRLDVLKLDSAFVRGGDGNDRTFSIVRGIIEIAHALGMVVVAEGIETEYQYMRLLGAGCDLGQGYYFARPMRADDLTAMLADDTLTLPITLRRTERRRVTRPWSAGREDDDRLQPHASKRRGA